MNPNFPAVRALAAVNAAPSEGNARSTKTAAFAADLYRASYIATRNTFILK
jgi:hypothetical protein